MVVTNMFDPADQKASDKMNAGEITGSVYEWHSDTGYKLVPDSEMSGNNGIEVSHDGKWIYVAAWGNKELVRLSREGQPPKRTALPAGFLVDNLRWAPDGMLMVAGQDVGADKVFACFQSDSVRCTQLWRVLQWDTAAMKLHPVMAEAGNPEFGDATVALEVGGDTFIATFRGGASERALSSPRSPASIARRTVGTRRA